MKEGIIDVLMFLLENYVDDGIPVEPDWNNLEDQLIEAGFGNFEVNKAFDWLEDLSRLEPVKSDAAFSRSMRVYRPEEAERLGREGMGLLYFLEQNGVLSNLTREQVIERVLALDSTHLDLDQLKWVVLMVLFNQPHEGGTDLAWLEELVYDERPINMH
ncbi:MAG TPA: DUF494 domain-containing protein [Gammaproteobacteria bacterium]|nr:DUF494 domain-containing protein [Gammaproteobacteria bacterium]